MSIPSTRTVGPTLEERAVQPVWYEDGDIVLSVKNGEIEEQFLVHRQVLRRTSQVFRDMLAMPQPEIVEGSEGHPVIHLDDSATDLRALLSALYDGLALFRDNQLTLDVLLSILLLSDKYGMDDLRRGVTRLLLAHWPLKHSDYLDQRLYRSPSRVIESMKVITTAQLCQVPELLPTAFYELAVSQIGGWSEADIRASHHLSPADLSRLLVGRELSQRRLLKLVVWNENTLPVLWDHDSQAAPATIFTTRASWATCTGSNRSVASGISYCHNSLFSLLKTKVGTELIMGRSTFLLVLQPGDFSTTRTCTNCIHWFMSIWENKQQEIWENIPVDFDLPKIDSKMYSESVFQPL